MKWSAGPIIARASVSGFRQISLCTPETLRQTTYGYALYNLVEYWEHLPPAFFGMTIYLEDEQWLDQIILPKARSYGDSWIVLNSETLERAWLTSTPDINTNKIESAKPSKRSRSINPALRFEIFRRDNFTCRYCGRRPTEVKLQVDHIIPWSKGGSNEISNLCTSCSECNIGKSARLI
jgi:hypothetical protein